MPKDIPYDTISVQDAQGKLSELIHRLAPGEEPILTENVSGRRSVDFGSPAGASRDVPGR